MIRINKLTDYAMLLLTRLATDVGELHSAQRLAEATGIELPTASKTLKLLCQAGLLESVRGAHGGYRLAMPPERISVLDVISAIEGPVGITECSVAPGQCELEADCGCQSNWHVIEQEIRGLLARLSLFDMQRPLKAGMLSASMQTIPIAVQTG